MGARFSKLLLGSMMFMGIALAACDAPADETATTREGSDLPVTSSSSMPSAPAVEEEASGSTAESSPGGEGVTAEEIPHSDVPPPSRQVFTDADCNFEGWVGKPVDEAAVKAAGRPFRLLTPDAMMTMDHSPERINVVHDKDKVVTRVWCG